MNFANANIAIDKKINLSVVTDIFFFIAHYIFIIFFIRKQH